MTSCTSVIAVLWPNETLTNNCIVYFVDGLRGFLNTSKFCTQLNNRRGIAKAVRYFELAGDSKRVIAVVDRALVSGSVYRSIFRLETMTALIY